MNKNNRIVSVVNQSSIDLTFKKLKMTNIIENNPLEILGDKYQRIIIETNCSNPITIAEITNENVEVINGYRVKLKPSDY
ncbi:hypothetical protein KWV16_11975 [Clostridioides difficile]|nr:hypothetical protein [Clostridioides difficile]